MNELKKCAGPSVGASEYSAWLGFEHEPADVPSNSELTPDVWGMAAALRQAESESANEECAPSDTEFAPHSDDTKPDLISAEERPPHAMAERRIAVPVRAGMGRMAVAAAFWPGIDRRGLDAAAQVGGTSDNYAQTGRAYLLDRPTAAKHVCNGAAEAGPRALIARVCIPNMALRGVSRHEFVYVPSEQLVALGQLAMHTPGSVAWLEAARAELQRARFSPPNLAKIIERQRELEVLAAQQLHHGL